MLGEPDRTHLASDCVVAVLVNVGLAFRSVKMARSHHHCQCLWMASKYRIVVQVGLVERPICSA